LPAPVQKKKFIFDLAILLVLNLLIKPFWILIVDPKVQMDVGNIMYGEYIVLFNFSFLSNILLDLGLANFNNRNIAQNSHLLSKHFSKLLTLKFALGLLYFIVTLALAAIIYQGDLRYIKLLLVLCFNSFLLSMIAFMRSYLQGLHLFRVDSIVSVLDRVIMLIIFFAMMYNLFGLKVDIMNYAYAQTAGYALTAFIGFVIVLGKTHTFKLSWHWPFNWMILKQSFPFAVLVLLMTFYNRFDSVMIERLLPGDFGKSQTGIYAKAFRLLDAANNIAILFAVQLLPIFSRMIKQKDSIENIVKLSFTILVAPAIIVSISCLFYSDEFCKLLYNGSAEGHEILGVLMCCFTAISMTYIFGTLLTANGNFKQLNTMAIFGILVNVILNFILIPRFYAYGSAVASLITQFFTALVQVYICYKVFNFHINKKLLTSLFLFILGVIFINYFTVNLTTQWKLNFVMMLIFSGLFAFVTGLINHKSILRFIKYK
jgi:O-antigen/teichoic acid export membrane protein